jgi:hypothetical protein
MVILAKLDYLNPGLSKKDRIARQIIEDAESDGTLKPGQTVVELTSGNTGTGLAIVCAAKGYSFVAVMSKGNSKERARMMSALGAEVVLVDQLPQSKPGQVSGGDLELVEKEARRIVEERQAFRADQFRLTGNFRAHYLHTGPEFISSPAVPSMPFAISSARAAHLPDVRPLSKNITPIYNVLLSSRMVPLCSQASRSPIQTTAFKAAAIPCPFCPSFSIGAH